MDGWREQAEGREVELTVYRRRFLFAGGNACLARKRSILCKEREVKTLRVNGDREKRSAAKGWRLGVATAQQVKDNKRTGLTLTASRPEVELIRGPSVTTTVRIIETDVWLKRFHFYIESFCRRYLKP